MIELPTTQQWRAANFRLALNLIDQGRLYDAWVVMYVTTIGQTEAEEGR